eukprot:scaffold204472_cov21-Tisochrysis_lutea.AAC.2
MAHMKKWLTWNSASMSKLWLSKGSSSKCNVKTLSLGQGMSSKSFCGQAMQNQAARLYLSRHTYDDGPQKEESLRDRSFKHGLKFRSLPLEVSNNSQAFSEG